ncbi:hypothetical protein HK104_008486 [Borealophlyctis nickersoniae]|nr:hypothetical protein HK104_008486 [Borealophlyctis nickersoniae]
MADLYGSGIFVDSSEPQGAKQANKGSKVNAAAADEGSGSVGGPRHVRFGGRVVEEHLSGVTANDQYTEAERRGAAYEMADAAAHERV